MPADANFAPPPPVPDTFVWHPSSHPSFCLDGFPWSRLDAPPLRRLPSSIWDDPSLPDTLRHVAKQPAGGLLRFQTDATSIALHVTLGTCEFSRSVPLTALSGFDVYLGERHFAGNLSPNDPGAISFAAHLELPSELVKDNTVLREIGLYLPLQNPPHALEIGLPPGSRMEPARTRAQRVVCYGSSITQGFCASRPGLSYPARMCRQHGWELVNLGFGGNCRGERAIAGAIAELPMDGFVYDYDHNAPGVDELRERHEAFLRVILQKQPALPVLILSSPNHHNDAAYFDEREAVLRATFDNLSRDGYPNLGFLSGGRFWMAEDEATVDRLHPNDYGFACMARHAGSALNALIARTT